MINHFLDEIKGINLIDIGSSGYLDPKWAPLNNYINLIGFDPNEEECKRMGGLPHPFKNVRYLPYAVAGERALSTLYKTKSIYCYSLLKPNTEWLNRFEFGHLFETAGEDSLHTAVLKDIDEIKSMDVDVLKVDTQGMELPILRNAGVSLEQAFYVETETGFVTNYMNESTYAEVDLFMREKGFMLFDLNTSHRIARNNIFKDAATGAEQLMWCEAVWLKDYVSLAEENRINKDNFGRNKLLKSLILCALQGCVDYGYEIATLGYELGYLTNSELTSLGIVSNWELPGTNKVKQPPSYKLFNYFLRLLPANIRQQIAYEAEIAKKQKHLLKGL